MSDSVKKPTPSPAPSDWARVVETARHPRYDARLNVTLSVGAGTVREVAGELERLRDEVDFLNARIDELRASSETGIVSQAVLVVTELTRGVIRINSFGSPEHPGKGAEEYADAFVNLMRTMSEAGPIPPPAGLDAGGAGVDGGGRDENGGEAP